MAYAELPGKGTLGKDNTKHPFPNALCVFLKTPFKDTHFNNQNHILCAHMQIYCLYISRQTSDLKTQQNEMYSWLKCHSKSSWKKNLITGNPDSCSLIEQPVVFVVCFPKWSKGLSFFYIKTADVLLNQCFLNCFVVIYYMTYIMYW